MEQHVNMDKSVQDWRKNLLLTKRYGKTARNISKQESETSKQILLTKKQVGYANKVMEEKMEEMNENQRFLAQQILDKKKNSMNIGKKQTY